MRHRLTPTRCGLAEKRLIIRALYKAVRLSLPDPQQYCFVVELVSWLLSYCRQLIDLLKMSFQISFSLIFVWLLNQSSPCWFIWHDHHEALINCSSTLQFLFLYPELFFYYDHSPFVASQFSFIWMQLFLEAPSIFFSYQLFPVCDTFLVFTFLVIALITYRRNLFANSQFYFSTVSQSALNFVLILVYLL